MHRLRKCVKNQFTASRNPCPGYDFRCAVQGSSQRKHAVFGGSRHKFYGTFRRSRSGELIRVPRALRDGGKLGVTALSLSLSLSLSLYRLKDGGARAQLGISDVLRISGLARYAGFARGWERGGRRACEAQLKTTECRTWAETEATLPCPSAPVWLQFRRHSPVG